LLPETDEKDNQTNCVFSVQSRVMLFGCVYICALLKTDSETCFVVEGSGHSLIKQIDQGFLFT